MSFKLPEIVKERKTNVLEQEEIKVKLFEFSDLIQREALKRFFEKHGFGLIS